MGITLNGNIKVNGVLKSSNYNLKDSLGQTGDTGEVLSTDSNGKVVWKPMFSFGDGRALTTMSKKMANNGNDLTSNNTISTTYTTCGNMGYYNYSTGAYVTASTYSNDYYNLTSSYVQVKQSGFYFVHGYWQGSSSGEALLSCRIYRNSGTNDTNYILFDTQYISACGVNPNVSTIVYLDANDKIYQEYRKDSGSGTLTTTGNSHLEIIKIG